MGPGFEGGSTTTLPTGMRSGAGPRTIAIAGAWMLLLAGLAGCSAEQPVPPTEPVATSSTTTLPPAPTTSTSPPTTSTTTTTVPTTTTTTPVPWRIPSDQVAHVEELVATVEALRGRSFEERPWVDIISADEYPIRHSAAAGPGFGPYEMGYLTAFFELLGMVSPGTDLAAFYARHENAPPGPFYDPVEREVLIPEHLLPLDDYQSLVMVGELTKAMSHQHHPSLVEAIVAIDGGDVDRSAAHRALLEGEAILVQTLYIESLPPERRAVIADQARVAAEAAYSDGGSGLSPEEAPRLMVETARFPTWAGASLVIDLYRQGGFNALDQALDLPPETTEQVLHPDRYRALEPAVEMDPFGLVVSGYEVVAEGTWGELRWRGLLAHHGDQVNAARAAEGWGGDRYQLLWAPDSGKLAFAVRLAADSFVDESEVNAAVRDLITTGMDVGDSRVVDTATEWEGADYAMISWDVGVITWVVASDTEVGRQIAAQLGVNLA